MNRIGRSDYWCVFIDQPHFMQKTIIKKDSGLYVFQDTVKYYIKTKAQLNDSWIFDSTFNYTATVNNVYTDSVFGNIDSIKTISNGKTIMLSKNYGIIWFDDIYGRNDNYELVGIEGSNLGVLNQGFQNIS